MRRRSNLLVVLGIAFFLIGGVIVYLLTDDDDGTAASADAQPVTVVVASNDIAAGALADELIAQGGVTTQEIAPGQLVSGAIQSTNQLAGSTFIQGFAKGQQITSGGLQMQNRTFTVPEGFDAVAVQLDFVSGGAGYVSPGDLVNLYGLFKTASADRPAPRAELLLTNVEVLDVDLTIPPRRGSSGATADGSSGQAPQRPSSNAVTYLLALRPHDAEKVIYQAEFESLYATLPADEAPAAGPTPGRDAQSILAEEPNAAFNG